MLCGDAMRSCAYAVIQLFAINKVVDIRGFIGKQASMIFRRLRDRVAQLPLSYTSAGRKNIFPFRASGSRIIAGFVARLLFWLWKWMLMVIQ